MLNGGFLVLFVLLCCKHKPYNLAHAVMFGSGDREQQCLPDCRGWGSGDGQHCGDSWRGRPDRGCLWHQHPSWGKHLRVAPRLQSGWTGLHGEQRRWWWWRCQLVWVAVFVSPIFFQILRIMMALRRVTHMPSILVVCVLVLPNFKLISLLHVTYDL